MSRKTLTQCLPFLLPLRLKQRKRCYYLKMRLDANRYAQRKEPLFPYELTSARSILINEHTGADIRYQYNKVHNLRLAAAAVSGVVIQPGETFSIWWLLRHADREEPYRDGLCVHNGKLVAVYGGGLCQISNLLFWMFLHTPLTIVERHMHHIKEFPNPSPEDPCGVDATILEGWLDLRARNDTSEALQIRLSVEDEFFCGSVRVERPVETRYDVVNRNLRYEKVGGVPHESVEVIRRALRQDQVLSEEKLYVNECELGYDPWDVSR